MTSIDQNYIGCDVSKARLDFFDPARGRHCRIANEAAAMEAFVAGLRPGVDFVVMEATGHYDRLLRLALSAGGIAFSRHNPQHTHHFSRSVGRRAKTDRQDAVMLAEYGRLHKPAPDAAPDAEVERLQALARRRDQLVDIRARERKHLAEAFDPDVRADIEALVAILNTRIAALEAGIRDTIGQSRDMARNYAILTSAPGVATVTALTLIAHMPELGRRSPKTIAALAGLAPIANESGRRIGKSAIAGGRTRVRCALYMAALGAIRASARFKATYEQIAARAGSRKLAIIAIARKLLVALNAMIRDQKQFI